MKAEVSIIIQDKIDNTRIIRGRDFIMIKGQYRGRYNNYKCKCI